MESKSHMSEAANSNTQQISYQSHDLKSARLRKQRFPRRLRQGDIELIRLSLNNNPERREELFALYTKNRNHLLPWHLERAGLLFADVGEMERHIKKYARKYGQSWHAVYYAGALAGLMELLPTRDGESQGVCLAYWVDESHTRKGIMRTAISMVEQALQPMAIDFVETEISINNLPSIKLMEKCAYRKYGVQFHIFASEEANDPTVLYRKHLSGHSQ